MSLQVIIFFFALAVAVLASGLLLHTNFKAGVTKKFAYSMLAMGASFAIWGLGLLLGAEGSLLSLIITIGLFVFSIAQIINIYIVAYDERTTYKYAYLAYGLGLLISIFTLRLFLPSAPEIAENGMIFFNPDETVNFLEILFISSALIPANLVVWREMQKESKNAADLLSGSVFAALIGGLLLITTVKVTLLTYVGWAMGLAAIAMLVSTSGALKKTK